MSTKQPTEVGPLKPTVLLISDASELCPALATHLLHGGCGVVEAAQAADGVTMARQVPYDAILIALLHAGVQEIFGTLEQARAITRAPILMLLRRSEETDRILALELGADDCLSPPFGLREIVARVHAVRRRADPGRSDLPRSGHATRLAVGDVVLDPLQQVAYQHGRPLHLTAREFGLLETLLRRAGEVVRREDLAAGIPDREHPSPTEADRGLDIHMSRLRRKLGRTGEGAERIKTIRNIGYQYVHTKGE